MSKRAQLPRFRDPEVLVFEDDAPELYRLRKTTENDVYSTNIILTAVARHAATLTGDALSLSV